MKPKSASTLADRVKSVLRNLHWVLTACLVLGLIPAFRLAGLPFNINWPRLLTIYWVSLMFRSFLVAVILCIVAFPLKETLLPFCWRYWKHKPRLFIVTLFTAFMVWQFGWTIGFMLAVDTVAFLEVLDRISDVPGKLKRAAADVIVPAAYFFVGLVLVFCYNDVIASLEFVGTYSATYNRFDSILMGGLTVSQIAHSVMRIVPSSFFSFLELVYFGMFGQIGAALILTAIVYGKRQSLTFVGALLTAYYLALLLFFLWPGMSPFTICADHFSTFPKSLDLYEVQKVTILKPQLLWMNALKPVIDTDYYIAFPCMHIALPAIVLWFVRKWKRMAIALAAYDVILFAAILLLEQHYLVDLLGGLIVAAVAIAMVSPPKQVDLPEPLLSRTNSRSG